MTVYVSPFQVDDYIKNNKKCVGLPADIAADIAADTAHFQTHPKSNRLYGGGSKPIFIPSITSYKPINFSGINIIYLVLPAILRFTSTVLLGLPYANGFSSKVWS